MAPVHPTATSVLPTRAGSSKTEGRQTWKTVTSILWFSETQLDVVSVMLAHLAEDYFSVPLRKKKENMILSLSKLENPWWPAVCLPWVLWKEEEKPSLTFPRENVRGTCTRQESTASHYNLNIEEAKLTLLSSVFLCDRNFSNLKGNRGLASTCTKHHAGIFWYLYNIYSRIFK